MDPIKKNDSGAAVEDVQHRLVKAGYLAEDQVTGTFGAETEHAVLSLCRDCGIEPRAEVDNAVWTKLVDASFELGDRNLFLRVPFFHGADVRTLQEALSALGFSCGIADGIFGVHTEDALRRFQQRIPEHGREQERRIHAHIVMNTGIRVLQHLCNHPLHCAVTVFGEVAGNGREQRLEQVVFTQQIVGFKPVACLEQL